MANDQSGAPIAGEKSAWFRVTAVKNRFPVDLLSRVLWFNEALGWVAPIGYWLTSTPTKPEGCLQPTFSTNERSDLPARRVLRFKASQVLKNRINE